MRHVHAVAGETKHGYRGDGHHIQTVRVKVTVYRVATSEGRLKHSRQNTGRHISWTVEQKTSWTHMSWRVGDNCILLQQPNLPTYPEILRGLTSFILDGFRDEERCYFSAPIKHCAQTTIVISDRLIGSVGVNKLAARSGSTLYEAWPKQQLKQGSNHAANTDTAVGDSRGCKIQMEGIKLLHVCTCHPTKAAILLQTLTH